MPKLKDTPGGVPLTKERRFYGSIWVAAAAFCFSAIPSALLFGTPAISNYGLNRFWSIFGKAKAKEAVLQAHSEILFWVILYGSLAIGVIVGLMFYAAANPANQKNVINRGQKCDAAQLQQMIK